MARAKADASAGESKMNKTEMVKAALDDLGGGAKPQAIQDYIKDKFGTDLPKTIISNYKSVMKRKGGVGVRTGGARRGRPPGGGGGIRVEDLETVRGLVSRLGAEQVRRLVAVFA